MGVGGRGFKLLVRNGQLIILEIICYQSCFPFFRSLCFRITRYTIKACIVAIHSILWLINPYLTLVKERYSKEKYEEFHKCNAWKICLIAA